MDNNGMDIILDKLVTDQKANVVMAKLDSADYCNFGKFEVISEIEDLEVSKAVCKRLVTRIEDSK